VSDRNDPIFVVGAGRSGTTLLQSLIGSHPRVAAPPETHFFRRMQFGPPIGDLNDGAQLRRVVEYAVAPNPLQAAGFDAERIFERAVHGPRTLAGVLDAMMTDFAERQGKARWSEKTPVQPARIIWEHLPQAQVVHIIRDPMETVASNLAKTGLDFDPTTSAVIWRQFTLRTIAAGAERGPAHYLRVRYEDLARDPEAQMKVVFAFLEEEFDPSILHDRGRRLATLGSTTSPLTQQVLEPIAMTAPASDALLRRRDRARIAAVVAGVMPALGYPSPSRGLVAEGRAVNAVLWPWLSLRMKKRRVMLTSLDRSKQLEAQRRRREAKAAARRSQASDPNAR
jgi:hypothetical protein